MSLKRGHDSLQEADNKDEQQHKEIFESSPIEDRASKFVGLFSPTLPAKDLQGHLAYRKASHRMLAWRKPSTQQSLNKFKASSAPSTLYTTGFDDDGENYGGKKLEKLLIDLDITGAIVVARWYGGIMLGPIRFAHIEQVARDAINRWRASLDLKLPAKKVKVELSPAEEAEQKSRLAVTLVNRDSSIKVLRELLAEKKAPAVVKAAIDSAPASTGTPSSSQTVAVDYSAMPLSKMQQLEKARDTTISWILKQIDEAETKAKTDVSPQNLQQDVKPG